MMSTIDGRAQIDNMTTVRRADDIFKEGPYDPECSVAADPIELFVIEAGTDEEPLPHQTSLYLRIGGACE